MNGLQTFSIREARAQLSDIINQVSVTNRSFVITKFGKPKAIISRADDTQKVAAGGKKTNLPGFGLWTDRVEMRDAGAWIEQKRKQWSSRFST